MLGKDFKFIAGKTNWPKNEQCFSYYGIFAKYENLILHLLGEHQLRNASIALAAIEIIKKRFPVADDAIYAGLQNVVWPGRFEVTHCKIANMARTIILDGAHNVAGIKTLVKTLLASPYTNKKIVFVFGILQDKDYKKICKQLSLLVKKIIIFKVDSQRAVDPKILVTEWAKYLPASKIRAIDKLRELPIVLRDNEKYICVVGSLYGIAEAKKFLKS